MLVTLGKCLEQKRLALLLGCVDFKIILKSRITVRIKKYEAFRIVKRTVGFLKEF